MGTTGKLTSCSLITKLISLLTVIITVAHGWQCNICRIPVNNPCRSGRPLRAINGQQYTCDYKRNSSACPKNHKTRPKVGENPASKYYIYTRCHIGSGSMSTCCCPKPSPTSPCDQPVDQGTGYMALPRWFYDKNMDQCIPFLYRGLKGNENNFVNQMHCQLTCLKGGQTKTTFVPTLPSTTLPSTTLPVTTQKPVDDNPCCCGQPAKDDAGNSPQVQSTCQTFPCIPHRITCYQTPGEPVCPVGFWCHAGRTMETTACCPLSNPSRCTTPFNRGQGTETGLLRWFYNEVTQRCEEFDYLGLKGLENNFVLKAECEAECIIKSPCSIKLPGIQLTTCTSSASCQIGQWCHIGETAHSTVCCAGAVKDVCSLPKVTGTGEASLQRWYFDKSSGLCGQCKQFTYAGMEGNQNNFLTENYCKQACPGCVNPCPVGTPLLTASGQPTSCQTYSGSPTGSCPAAHWCHVGAPGQPTTACCPATINGGDYEAPGAGNVCDLQLSVGEGDESLERWYLSKSSGTCGTCIQFTYRGTKGNENNFRTKQACEASCPPCVNPCAKGEPLRGPLGKPTQCSPNSPCPDTHWCHVGASVRTTVCCVAASNVCNEPMSEGEGTDNLPRWYYDAQNRQCKPFTYKGLKGSQNMFLTLEDCQTIGCPMYQNACPIGQPILEGPRVRVCSEFSPCPEGYWCHLGPEGTDLTMCCKTNGEDPCRAPVSYGQGTYQVQRYYYDPTSKTCKQFTYTGMKGNVNNYLTEVDCAATCPVFEGVCANAAQPLIDTSTSHPIVCDSEPTAPCSPGYFCLVGSGPQTTQCCPSQGDPCTLPAERGAGKESLPRWYYDSSRSMCRRFIYSGKYGNENNFLTYQSCHERCPEANPCGAGQPLTDVSGPMRCETFITSGADPCPSNYYCHVGPASPQAMQALSDTDFSATVCCPKLPEQPCDQMQNAGAPLKGVPLEPDTRWYYDRQNDICTQFRYSGTQGNQNNFLTSRSCEETCPGYSRLCPHLKPLLALGVPQTCGVDQMCPQGYLCNVNLNRRAKPQGFNDDSTPSTTESAVPGVTNLLSEQTGVCCPNPADFCFESRLPGEPCTPEEARTFFFNEDVQVQGETRYGYNPDTNECVSYAYLGCGGSKNNFISLQKCTEICCNEFRLKLMRS